MWHTIWPGVPKHEVPIDHVTNGVHARSWFSPDLMQLLNRYLGTLWQDDPSDPKVWEALEDVPDEELWHAHEHRRHRLIAWTRRQLRKQLEARGMNPQQVHDACDGLSDNALTVGFARRFATYKRGNLFLRDPERLMRMLEDTSRPIQFLIAGKSHPADGGGKDLIRQIVKFAEHSEAGHRIVFLENYDIYVARYLVQGCDIWLNNPRRPMEASGTSGMKGAINGVLNCSVLDGWWDEAYDPEMGWAIGRRETYTDLEKADEIESKALYDTLENQVLPLFYDRDDQGIPRQWVKRMKNSIARLSPQFNTNRMVQEYADSFYLPALDRSRALGAERLKGSVELAHYKGHLRHAWPGVYVESVHADTHQPLGVDQSLPIEVVVQTGELNADQVRPQVYYGELDNDNQLSRGRTMDLEHVKSLGDGRHQFKGKVSGGASGRHGFAVRVVPAGDLGVSVPGLIRWEGEPHPEPEPEPEAEEMAPQEAEAG
jgi:starch phosphorylase